MSTLVETVFENGVFRPLTPVAIPENQRVAIRIDSAENVSDEGRVHPRLAPGEYAEASANGSESCHDYNPVPAKSVTFVCAQMVFAGKREPAPYQEN